MSDPLAAGTGDRDGLSFNPLIRRQRNRNQPSILRGLRLDDEPRVLVEAHDLEDPPHVRPGPRSTTIRSAPARRSSALSPLLSMNVSSDRSRVRHTSPFGTSRSSAPRRTRGRVPRRPATPSRPPRLSARPAPCGTSWRYRIPVGHLVARSGQLRQDRSSTYPLVIIRRKGGDDPVRADLPGRSPPDGGLAPQTTALEESSEGGESWTSLLCRSPPPLRRPHTPGRPNDSSVAATSASHRLTLRAACSFPIRNAGGPPAPGVPFELPLGLDELGGSRDEVRDHALTDPVDAAIARVRGRRFFPAV